MQLQWEGEGDEWEAKTPFGKYHIARDLFMHGLAWSYCFADRHDEGDFPAASVEEAKTRANEHWQDRIAPIIAPYVDKA